MLKNLVMKRSKPMSEDEIYDAIDTPLSLKSGDLKKIPLQKVTQMIEKKREEEDPYLEDDLYRTMKSQMSKASRSLDLKASRRARASGSLRGSGPPRRMIRRLCFYVTCFIVIGFLIVFTFGLIVGSWILATKLKSLEKRLAKLRCVNGREYLSIWPNDTSLWVRDL